MANYRDVFIATAWSHRKGVNEMGDELKAKPWYQSRTIISGIVAVAVAVWNAGAVAVAANFGHNLPTIPDWIFAILGSIGIYGRIDAKTKIGGN